MPKGDHKRKFDVLAPEAERRIRAGQTQAQVAQDLGLNRTTIERWCKRFGWPTHRTGPRSGSGHPDWKGGRVLVGGYWYIYTPDHPHATKTHRVAEHRLVMEQVLGRHLAPSEVVHHIDRNPQNNAPENLMVFANNAAHLRHELTGHVPAWTPEGRQRILASRRRTATPAPSKSDDPPRTPRSARPPT